MRILKPIILVIAAIIVLALLSALFVNKDYTIERSVTINKPKAEVFNYIKYLKNQNEYSKWATMDPAMKKTFSGTDGAPGFISAWESEKGDVGTGEQEIKQIIEGKIVDYEIRFKKPFPSVAQSYMSTDSTSTNQSLVKWSFSGHMPYPINLMRVVMNMDKMIGSDLQIGLNRLKAKLEN